MLPRLKSFLAACLLIWGGVVLAEADIRNLTVATAVEKRVALVIGNSAYAQGPLKNPVNDARAIASRLRSLGFQVILRENLKTREIGSVYREFRTKISPGGTALVFYAGHGLQVKGQNYLPAVDSAIDAEEDAPLQSLNLGTLLENMDEAKAGVSLVFLDACRDNPFARRFRSASRGLAKVETASGTLIHYATRPGSVAADGTGQNGTYTEALLAQMSEPGVPVELMLKKVTNRVMAATNGKQEPWIEGSLRGDFFFSPGKGNDVASHAPQHSVARTQEQIEDEVWDVIKASDVPIVFEKYLLEYPKGRYATLAKLRLIELQKNPVAAGSSNQDQANSSGLASANLLEWADADNGSDIDWEDAKIYCARKGSGWRLPTVAELQETYAIGRPSPCGQFTCKVHSKSRLGGAWFWSSEPDGSFDASRVDLSDGARGASNRVLRLRVVRALCVRSTNVADGSTR